MRLRHQQQLRVLWPVGIEEKVERGKQAMPRDKLVAVFSFSNFFSNTKQKAFFPSFHGPCSLDAQSICEHFSRLRTMILMVNEGILASPNEIFSGRWFRGLIS